MSQEHGTPSEGDTDLTQPGRTPGHGTQQPGQTGAPGRDVPPDAEPATTDVPDDEASPGTPD